MYVEIAIKATGGKVDEAELVTEKGVGEVVKTRANTEYVRTG